MECSVERRRAVANGRGARVCVVQLVVVEAKRRVEGVQKGGRQRKRVVKGPRAVRTDLEVCGGERDMG